MQNKSGISIFIGQLNKHFNGAGSRDREPTTSQVTSWLEHGEPISILAGGQTSL